jgi:1-aminocyclopropane-1-carboxylate deaminase
MEIAMLRLDKFERYPLTFGPTPIEHLPRTTAELGGKVEIYAKRDDCNSGLAMGDNKLRKLEYIVPDAIASNADTRTIRPTDNAPISTKAIDRNCASREC